MARALTIVMVAAVLVGGGGAVLAAGPARVVSSGPATTRTIALTFDDGWHPGRCAQIFDTLVRFDVPATWFPNAVYVGAAPGLWRRIAERFPIGNHTTHHVSLSGRSVRTIRHEIRSDERRIESVTGRPMSKILRPPYGAWDRRVRRVAGRLGYKRLVLWDVSAADTSLRATDRGVARAALRGRPGSIVLMHCGPAVTPRVLPIVIARYACAGFRFATVEGLLAGNAGVEAKVSCPPPKLPPRAGSARARRADDRSPDPPPGAGLAGREWRLTDVASGGALEPVPSDVVFTLRFGPRMASGQVGCGVYSAPFTAGTDGALGLGRLVRSSEGCDDGALDRAASYLDMLLASVGQRVVDDALELLDADGLTRLRFRTSAPAGLLGDWSVSAVADDDGAMATLAAGTTITASFGPTGTIGGSTGCNTYLGDYSTHEEAVSAGPLLSGPASCGDDLDGLEARFLAAMRSVAGWGLRDGTLELRDAADRVVLELVPRIPGP